VIKEAMRYYIVSPLVARETSNEVEIGGYLLPKVKHIFLLACSSMLVCTCQNHKEIFLFFNLSLM